MLLGRLASTLSSPTLSHTGRRFLAPVLLIALPLLLLGPVLGGQRALAFRDVSHFYRPLLSYLKSRQSDAIFPLWSPLDDFGAPLAGETSTALFYPGRLLFFLGLPDEIALGSYVALHLLLAAFGCYLLALGQTRRIAPSLLAAIAYTFGGSVFFLYTNPPFLVGAAWLPWMILAIVAGNRTRSWRNWPRTAAPFALGALGGDPQMSLHVALLVVGWVTLRWVGNRCRSQPISTTVGEPRATLPTSSSFSPGRSVSLPHGNWLGLFAAATIAAGMAAPQLAASYSWSQQSWRETSRHRTIWETSSQQLLASSEPRPDTRTNLWERPASGTHAADVFEFSLPPWALSQLLTPYVAGKMAGENERWMNAIPAAPRSWTPTIYVGLFPAIAFLLTCVRPSSTGDRRWFAMGLIGLLLSMGQFGAVYWFRVLLHLLGSTPDWRVPDAAGGPYWLLTAVLPGYGEFRYPSKWLPVAALGISLHSSVLLAGLDARGWRRLGRIAAIIGLASLLALMGAWLAPLRQLLEICSTNRQTQDRFWGPLDVESTIATLRLTLLHTTILAVALAFASRSKHRILLIAVLAIAEMPAVANWQLHTIPVSATQPRHVALADATELANSLAANRSLPRRVWLLNSAHPWPQRWQTELADSQRLIDVEQGQQQTWFVRWHLASRANVINNSLSIRPAASHRLFAAASSLDDATLAALAEYLSVDCLLRRHAPADSTHPALERVQPLQPQPPIRWYAEKRGRGSFLAPAKKDPRPLFWDPLFWDRAEGQPEALAYRAITAEVVEVELSTRKAGLLVAAWQQDGHWLAHIESLDDGKLWSVRPRPVDGVLQGVELPAGRYQIRLTYQPTWWWPSWVIASASWLSLAASMLAARWQRRQPTRSAA